MGRDQNHAITLRLCIKLSEMAKTYGQRYLYLMVTMGWQWAGSSWVLVELISVCNMHKLNPNSDPAHSLISVENANV